MLEVRNLRFSIGDGVPKHWHGAGRAVSIFFDGLSIFFPEGERFFVSSVRKHERFAEGELREDVRRFAAQEGIHGREHEGYNAHLERHGYPAARLEKKVTALLSLARKAPRRRQLGITCALEHFTGMMAMLLLGDPHNLAGAHPTMARLWRWHAAEESEHKAVPFDLFRAAGGTEFERITTMLVATAFFWSKVLQHQVVLMRADGCLWDLGEWGKLLRFLFVNPGGMRMIARTWLTYFRRGFHPRDLDDGALLEAWKLEHAREADALPIG
jgi:hypothetical protein